MIVEDGSIVAGANSYISFTDATAYHTSYGNDWTSDTAVGELALIQATRALDLIYGSDYLSELRSDSQNLLFPRYAFYDNNRRRVESTEIPQRLKDAVCEMAAIIVSGGDVLPETNPDDFVVEESSQVDVIRVTKKYDRPVVRSTTRKIDLIISPLVTSSNNQTKFSMNFVR